MSETPEICRTLQRWVCQWEDTEREARPQKQQGEWPVITGWREDRRERTAKWGLWWHPRVLTFGWFHAKPPGSVLPGSPRSCQEQVVEKAEPKAGGLSPVPGLPIAVSVSLLETQRGERERKTVKLRKITQISPLSPSQLHLSHPRLRAVVHATWFS